jgi:hypothetical protein
MRIYTDAQAEVHAGDTVRYVRWDYDTRGKFYGRTGTIVKVLDHGRGHGTLGVHFPHHPRGTNLLAIAEHFRLVACPHEDRRYGSEVTLTELTAAAKLNELFDLDVQRYGHAAVWNRPAFGLPVTAGTCGACGHRHRCECDCGCPGWQRPSPGREEEEARNGATAD